MSDENEKAAVSYELRPVRPEDDNFLLRVYSDTRADEMALVPWTTEQKGAFLRMQLEAQRRYYLEQHPEATHSLVVVDGAPAGRLYVARKTEEIRILDVAILIERRRAGIGSAVVGDLLAEARRTDLPLRIYVETVSPALSLFERLGFRGGEETGLYRLMEYRSHGARA